MKAVAALLLVAGCAGLSPLRGRAVVGRDAYVIFVADGPEGAPDLFGVRTDGGPVFQITYTNVLEAAPALSPDGGAVAFLRGASSGDTVPAAVWVLNLLTGADRELALPAGAPAPERVGWSPDGGSLYVRAGGARYALRAPPAGAAARVLTGAARAAADSSLWVLLGDPPFGRAVQCGSALCVRADTGAPTAFAENAHDAVRWGSDSVGYVSGGNLMVRPLGTGRVRRVEWTEVPAKPRDLTVFLGSEK